MEMKIVKEQLLFCAGAELARMEIPAYAQRTIERLHHIAHHSALEIAGCCQIVYLNSDGNPDKPVHLIIGLPVINRKPIDQEDVFFYYSEAYTCIYDDYKGPMYRIAEAWQQLINQVDKSDYTMGNQSREVYKHWVGKTSDENITELQIGIVGKIV